MAPTLEERRALRARRLSRLVMLLAAAAVAIFLIRGADRTVRPRILPYRGSVPSRVAGFNQIGFRIGGPAASTSPHCALLALTADQQNRGLMNRRDLAGYDGMLFVFAPPTATAFYMKDTLIPLSIAWFDGSGRYVSSTDMAPCVTVDCPIYQATALYTTAIEVAGGHLPQLGIGAGSTIAVGGAC